MEKMGFLCTVVVRIPMEDNMEDRPLGGQASNLATVENRRVLALFYK